MLKCGETNRPQQTLGLHDAATLRLASTHDHWSEAPAGEHALAACRLLHHFSKRHPAVMDSLEWAFGGLIAVALVTGTLIANA